MENNTKTDDEILIEIYKQNNLKKYNRCKKALECKDFEYLRSHGHPYVKETKKELLIESVEITEVIKELVSIKFERKDNEGPQSVYGEAFDESTSEAKIFVASTIYNMQKISICNVSKDTYQVKGSLWKLKNQPNGKDAKRISELILKHRLTDEG